MVQDYLLKAIHTAGVAFKSVLACTTIGTYAASTSSWQLILGTLLLVFKLA